MWRTFDFQALRRAFKGFYIANNGYDVTLAQKAIHAKQADLIAFGRPFIANPDLVERMRIGAKLNSRTAKPSMAAPEKAISIIPS